MLLELGERLGRVVFAGANHMNAQRRQGNLVLGVGKSPTGPQREHQQHLHVLMTTPHRLRATWSQTRTDNDLQALLGDKSSSSRRRAQFRRPLMARLWVGT